MKQIGAAAFTTECRRLWGPECEVEYRVSKQTKEEETEMQKKYQQKDGDISIFKNAEKSKQTDADYNGRLQLGGTAYAINLWKRQSKTSGQQYLGGSIRPKKDGGGKKAADFDEDLEGF
jgi:hypothetical protein